MAPRGRGPAGVGAPKAPALVANAVARGGSAARVVQVLVLSASMGAGHDGVARELARRLQQQGASATVLDYLRLLPLGLGAFYKAVYRWQLRWAPGSYEWMYSVIDGRGPLQQLPRLLGRLGRWRLRRVVLRGQYDLVVSTYPLASQAMGDLRRRGQLRPPAVTVLTDAEVHGLWLHEHVDAHVAVWPVAARQAARQLGREVAPVGPLLPPMWHEPVSRREREAARLRLPAAARRRAVVLLVAGSWGVGRVLQTARAIAGSGAGFPVVLCGRNEALRRDVERAGVGLAVGWTGEVRALLAAADVLVHNAGGLACSEGFAVGVPVIGHACLPGHGWRNAVAMRDSGVASYAADDEELVAEVRRLAGTPAGTELAAAARRLFTGDPTAELLQLAAGQPALVPVAARRAPALVPAAARRALPARAAAALVAVLALAWAGLTFGVAEASERGLGLARGTAGVYLAVELDPGQTSAASRLAGQPVSVGLDVDEDGSAVQPLRVAGLAAVGLNGGTTGVNPNHQAEHLSSLARAVRVANGGEPADVVMQHRLAPAEALVAWRSHIGLARADVTVAHAAQLPALQLGDRVVLDLRGVSVSRWSEEIGALLQAVHTDGLRPVPMVQLWR